MKLGVRRLARERAIQFLYETDLNPVESLDYALEAFWNLQRYSVFYDDDAKALWNEKKELPPPTAEDLAVQEFMEALVRGVLEHRAQLDTEIAKYAKNWDISRMAAVDRNVLRLAIYEMMFREDIPPVVSINEAVDIAKKFSTDESGRFVNGILDVVRTNILRPSRG